MKRREVEKEKKWNETKQNSQQKQGLYSHQFSLRKNGIGNHVFLRKFTSCQHNLVKAVSLAHTLFLHFHFFLSVFKLVPRNRKFCRRSRFGRENSLKGFLLQYRNEISERIIQDSSERKRERGQIKEEKSIWNVNGMRAKWAISQFIFISVVAPFSCSILFCHFWFSFIENVHFISI